MHHQYRLPYPPPDITPTPTSSSSRPHTILPQQDPPDSHSPFLIISIFALRLANQLIHSLVPYPEQVHDTTWLTTFLAPYAAHHALAKIAGQRQEDYESRYQKIVARMKRQPQYPVCFMRLNPDRRDDGQRGGEMCDEQRLAIINFSDAAFEWGSMVPLPAREAERMLELAAQRCIADF